MVVAGPIFKYRSTISSILGGVNWAVPVLIARLSTRRPIDTQKMKGKRLGIDSRTETAQIFHRVEVRMTRQFEMSVDVS